ncbi:MAG: aminoacetone oxidase family FAD-binding enzyme [Clostridia bacterium]|nr:aminoacetone oxidase family FAD-binding enzyme [Clostridia bacterium]
MEKFFDVCIVGGGASGLAAAVYIKQKKPSVSVAVLERLPRVGKKLITTGNGRCNLTNSDESITHFHGDNPYFAEYAILKYNNKELERFFKSIGLPLYYDETGRAYPASLQASSVVDALRFSCDMLGVDTFVDCMVTDIIFGQSWSALKTELGDFSAKSVVFATGLYSGGKKLGCDGYIYKLLKSKGEKCIPVTPAIVQVKTDTDIVRALKGIKVNAAASLYISSKLVKRATGEVLFCDYGLSGPPILQIAREVERKDTEKTISLDLMPESNIDEVVTLLLSLRDVLYYRKLDEYLSGAINKRLGQSIIKSAGLKLSDSVNCLQESDIRQIAKVIKSFNFRAVSTTGFENSQVTAGGLDTCGFDNRTMMSKKYKGVYAVGELLDIDGDCGGYNLHFAFSSAFCAAESILEGIENGKD